MLTIGNRNINTQIRLSPRGQAIETQYARFERARQLSPEDKIPALLAGWYVAFIYSLPEYSIADKNDILASSSVADMEALYGEVRYQVDYLNKVLGTTPDYRRRLTALLITEHIETESLEPELALAIEEILIVNGRKSHHAIEAFLAMCRTSDLSPDEEVANVCAFLGQEIPKHLRVSNDE